MATLLATILPSLPVSCFKFKVYIYQKNIWQSICRLLDSAVSMYHIKCVHCVTGHLHSCPFRQAVPALALQITANELMHGPCCPWLGEESEGCCTSSAILMHPGHLEGTVVSVIPHIFTCKPKQMKSIDRRQS